MSGVRPWRVVLSCEHASHRVPARWRALFAGRRALLRSHRGWDPGALELARRLARRLGAPLVAAPATRLLADTNRSPRHPRLFSEWTRPLQAPERERLLDAVYRPHRRRVEALVARGLAAGRPVLHVGVHSFTPRLRGVVRRADVGVLYDPARPRERRLALELRRRLSASGRWRVRLNQPYRGSADGLTTALRRRHPPRRYLGLELELNQRHVRGPRARWRALQRDVVASLAALGSGAPARDRSAGNAWRHR